MPGLPFRFVTMTIRNDKPEIEDVIIPAKIIPENSFRTT